MALTMPENSGGTFEICPEGNHVAVCSSVIDMGTQVVKYEGQDEKHQRKIYISWEIKGEQKKDGSPFYIGKAYTYSSHEKATLRKDLESWRGQKFKESDFGVGGFEIKKVIGVGCMLNVVHSDGEKVYANIASIARLPKDFNTPSLTEPPTYFSLEADEFNVTVFDELSDKMQDKIIASPEYQGVTGTPDYVMAANDDDEECSPF